MVEQQAAEACGEIGEECGLVCLAVERAYAEAVDSCQEVVDALAGGRLELFETGHGVVVSGPEICSCLSSQQFADPS